MRAFSVPVWAALALALLCTCASAKNSTVEPVLFGSV